MIEIKIDYTKLAISISGLKKLKNGTGFSQMETILDNSCGKMKKEVVDLYNQLHVLEKNLVDIVGKTQTALENAGMKFSESENLIANIMDAINSVKGANAVLAEKEAKKREWENKINAMKNKDTFKQGAYWGDDSSCYKYNGVLVNGSQCWAMARMMMIELFGKRGSYIDVSGLNVSDIKIGDVLQYGNENLPNQYWGHTVIILGKTETGFLIGEGNWGDKVSYRELPFADIQKIKSIERI